MKNTVHQTLTLSPLPAMTADQFSRCFAPHAEKPWAMLLDSAGDQHPDAGFDIMLWDPIATLSYSRGNIRIEQRDTGQTCQLQGDPLKHLHDLQEHYFAEIQLPVMATALPFLAGAMGYLGYDVGRQYETLPNQTQDDYQSPDCAFGVYTWSVIRQRSTNKVWYCRVEGYPYPDESLFLQPQQTPDQEQTFALTSAWHANMTPEDYAQRIDHIHDYLRAGDCYQVNLAQRFTASCSGSPWHAYQRLTASNNAPFSAFIRLPHSAILSISPERFISVRDGQVETKPIKGTRPRAESRQQDQANKAALRSSPKDQAENLMIVDLLRNDLSKNCRPGSIDVPALFEIESFAAVHHLVSTVTGELAEGRNAMDLIRDAFPGGSITGAPKVRAMEVIDELEPHRRHIYCGSIGYFGIGGDMDTSICIRTLLWEDGTLYCWAGGGIVLDSNAQEEYQETLDKVSRILPVLEQS